MKRIPHDIAPRIERRDKHLHRRKCNSTSEFEIALDVLARGNTFYCTNRNDQLIQIGHNIVSVPQLFAYHHKNDQLRTKPRYVIAGMAVVSFFRLFYAYSSIQLH